MDTETKLVRLENSLWHYPLQPDDKTDTFTELRIETEIDAQPNAAFRLAEAVSQILSRQKLQDFLKQDVTFFECEKSGSKEEAPRRFKITRESGDSGLWHYVKQQIAFLRTFPDKRIVTLKVESDAPSILERIVRLFQTAHPVVMVKERPFPVCEMAFDFDMPFEKRVKGTNFSDPFTKLATLAFQTVEPHFTSTLKPKAAYRYVLQDGVLKLVEQKYRKTIPEQAENRKLVSAYEQFVIQEYGREHIQYIEHNYGFSFQKMIQRGDPLLIDHVFRINVGVNSIEMRHVEALFEKLLELNRKLGLVENAQIDALFNMDIFSFREIRGLLRCVPKADECPTFSELKTYLRELLEGAVSLRKLESTKFNQITLMLTPKAEDIERALTGRKIQHKAIMGYQTTGEDHTTDPCRDLFELLHVFQKIHEENDWDFFHEILPHVVSKKNLFRLYPGNGKKSKLQVGLLIPAPRDHQGSTYWYYNDAFYDDHAGGVNYVLLPACDTYTMRGARLPMIKLYRSTVSERDGIDWLDSIEANLNPTHAPGSLDPEATFDYEKSYFDERTIPIWVGYLLMAEKQIDSPYKKEILVRRALDEYLEELQRTSHKDSEQYKKAKELNESEVARIQDCLFKVAKDLKELPDYKLKQHMIFSGHSLGGGMAELGMCSFGLQNRRIPLPECNFIGYSFNSPGIDSKLDATFMELGRKHAKLIEGLEQRWKIHYQFEHGDIFPQGGGSHLGTTGYDALQDENWLDVSVSVFRPQTEAEALTITTAETHGRRIADTSEIRDYNARRIEPKKLYEFNHSWWLSSELENIFGGIFVESPEGFELARRIVSVLARPFMIIAELIYNFMYPVPVERKVHGILSSQYEGRKIAKIGSAKGPFDA